MKEVLTTLLMSPFGSFAFVFGIIIGCGWIIHYVTKKVTEINSNHSVLAQKVNKIEDNIDEIRKDLAYLKGTIQSKNDLVQSYSPISLTAKGREKSREMDAEQIVAQNWDTIVDYLDAATKNKNAYDIQQCCIETAAVQPEKFFDKDSLNKLKLYAFNTGKPYQYISIVPALIIRDKYFAIKNINIKDTDTK